MIKKITYFFSFSQSFFFANNSSTGEQGTGGAADDLPLSNWKFWRKLIRRYHAARQLKRQQLLGRLHQQHLPGVEPPAHPTAIITKMGNVNMEGDKKLEKVHLKLLCSNCYINKLVLLII